MVTKEMTKRKAATAKAINHGRDDSSASFRGSVDAMSWGVEPLDVESGGSLVGLSEEGDLIDIVLVSWPGVVGLGKVVR